LAEAKRDAAVAAGEQKKLIRNCLLLEEKMGAKVAKALEDNDRIKWEKMVGAVRVGDIDKIRHLHERGVDIKQRDKYGYTLAWYAMFHEKIESMALLKELGLDLTEPCDMQETTPLAWVKDRYGIDSSFAKQMKKLLIVPLRFTATEKIYLENGFQPPRHRVQNTDFVLMNME
jgi:ankyrin repeat protein